MASIWIDPTGMAQGSLLATWLGVPHSAWGDGISPLNAQALASGRTDDS